MNIYDISKRAGVSIATVSRVINGSPKVSDRTKLRVMKVIEESGYTPNAFARGLGLNTMKTVGILCTDARDPYFADAIYYVQNGLRQNGYDSLLCCTGHELEAKQSYVELLLSKRVDGIVMVGSSYIESKKENNLYIMEAAATVPVIMINGVLEAQNVYCTVCDDYQGIFDMTQSFIDSGKRRLVYLYNSISYSGKKKLAGFKAAMESSGIATNQDNFVFIDKSLSLVKDNIKKLNEVYGRIHYDGVIASEDALAVVALKSAVQSGVGVPDGLFVAGFNNFPAAQYTEPEITSVDNCLEAICRHSVTTLCGVLDGNNMPKTTVFSPKIIERSSTRFTKK